MHRAIHPLLIGIGACAIAALPVSVQSQPRSQPDIESEAQRALFGASNEARRDTKDLLAQQKKQQADKKAQAAAEKRAAEERQRSAARGPVAASGSQQKPSTAVSAATVRQPVPTQAPRAYK